MMDIILVIVGTWIAILSILEIKSKDRMERGSGLSCVWLRCYVL